MCRFKKYIKWLGVVILAILLMPIMCFTVLYYSADMGEPKLRFAANDRDHLLAIRYIVNSFEPRFFGAMGTLHRGVGAGERAKQGLNKGSYEVSGGCIY